MGTWYNRVPIIKDNFGIRTTTPQECLALREFPKSFDFPDIPIKSMYKQCGNTVVVPIVKRIAEQIAGCHSKQLLNQYTRCLLNIYFTVNVRLRLENAYDKQSRKLKKLFLHRT